MRRSSPAIRKRRSSRCSACWRRPSASRGRFILNRECRRSLAEHGLGGIYPRLLRSYVRDFNWAYRDRYPDLGFIQRSFFFTLYLLHLYGGEWLPAVFYEDAFLRAVPRVLSDVAATPYFTPA